MKYLITLFLSFSVTVFSQDASQILNSLSEKTKSYKNISIDFDFKYENELEDIIEKKSGKIIIENEKFKDNVVIGGLMLCKAPTELVDERTEHFKEQTSNQIKSVDNNLMRENDPRMPLFHERKSKVTFGKGT